MSADRAVTAALRTSAVHVPDRLGFCLGCRELWGHLTPYPCSVTIWAAYLLAGRRPW
ncbi:hypothetical protein ACNTMW_09200 [Planosporangium sp. 12N6]|uniref:hypothetical protein n=1 Tax=Planosporangium spinosum TaxID=3402278 RepID=UPI003CF1346C